MMKSLTFNDCYKENENTVILEQGNICCNLYVLLEGTLEVNIIDANGNEVLIEHIESPRHFYRETDAYPYATSRIH